MRVIGLTLIPVLVSACIPRPVQPSEGICITVQAVRHRGLTSVCGPIDRIDVLERVIADARERVKE